MVKTINQRKAFYDAGVVGGIDNGRQKTRNHGYDVIVGGELFTGITPITPRKLVTLNSKLKPTGAGCCLSSSCRWDAYRKQLA